MVTYLNDYQITGSKGLLAGVAPHLLVEWSKLGLFPSPVQVRRGETGDDELRDVWRVSDVEQWKKDNQALIEKKSQTLKKGALTLLIARANVLKRKGIK